MREGFAGATNASLLFSLSTTNLLPPAAEGTEGFFVSSAEVLLTELGLPSLTLNLPDIVGLMTKYVLSSVAVSSSLMLSLNRNTN